MIATSTKVDISGLDQSTLEKIASPEYFARGKKSRKEKGEEAFIKQGEKPEVRDPRTRNSQSCGIGIADVCMQKKAPASQRAADQKTIDKPLLSAIKNEEFLASYLKSSFSLRHGQKPHEMVF